MAPQAAEKTADLAETGNDKKNRDEMATVIQKNLPPGAVANHQARSGRTYPITSDSNKPCEVPLEDAYTFLIDEAFEVRGPDGKVITPPSNKKPDSGRLVLEEDEVVARLEELTQESLIKRAKRFAGSEVIKKTTAKDDIISFILANKPEVNVAVTGRSDGVVAPQMDRESLDSLLGPVDLGA